jgi:RHS repeat-associated protein
MIDRMQQQALMRWIAADPVGYPDGANRYQFVTSNPVNQVDPLGLEEAI